MQSNRDDDDDDDSEQAQQLPAALSAAGLLNELRTSGYSESLQRAPEKEPTQKVDRERDLFFLSGGADDDGAPSLR